MIYTDALHTYGTFTEVFPQKVYEKLTHLIYSVARE